MRRSPMLRVLIAAALTVAFLAGLAGTSQAQAAGTASITIHVLSCDHVPATDWFSECHNNSVAGSSVKVGTATQTTDGTGNTTFSALATGKYAVSAPVAGATSGFAYCSSPAGRAEGWHVNGVFTVSALAAGEAVICDSFGVVIPAPPVSGTLTIHKRVCAAGEPVTDIFTDCHGNLTGVSGVVMLTAGGSAQTVGASGNVTWTLNNGTYAVTENASGAGDASSRVFCSANDGSASEVASSNGNFSVAVNGNSVICDSYTLLSAGPAPTVVPTVAPTTVPAPTKTAGNGTTSLPNTGVAPSDGNNSLLLGVFAALALAAFALGGAELARRRNHKA